MCENIRVFKKMGVYKENGEVSDEFKEVSNMVKLYEMLDSGALTREMVTAMYHDVCSGSDPEELAIKRGYIKGKVDDKI